MKDFDATQFLGDHLAPRGTESKSIRYLRNSGNNIRENLFLLIRHVNGGTPITRADWTSQLTTLEAIAHKISIELAKIFQLTKGDKHPLFKFLPPLPSLPEGDVVRSTIFQILKPTHPVLMGYRLDCLPGLRWITHNDKKITVMSIPDYNSKKLLAPRDWIKMPVAQIWYPHLPPEPASTADSGPSARRHDQTHRLTAKKLITEKRVTAGAHADPKAAPSTSFLLAEGPYLFRYFANVLIANMGAITLDGIRHYFGLPQPIMKLGVPLRNTPQYDIGTYGFTGENHDYSGTFVAIVGSKGTAEVDRRRLKSVKNEYKNQWKPLVRAPIPSCNDGQILRIHIKSNKPMDDKKRVDMAQIRALRPVEIED